MHISAPVLCYHFFLSTFICIFFHFSHTSRWRWPLTVPAVYARRRWCWWCSEFAHTFHSSHGLYQYIHNPGKYKHQMKSTKFNSFLRQAYQKLVKQLTGLHFSSHCTNPHLILNHCVLGSTSHVQLHSWQSMTGMLVPGWGEWGERFECAKLSLISI